jgi:TolA-binding protein
MGLFDKLFGGGDPEAKAKKAEAKAKRDAEEAAEAKDRADNLLQTALGNKPEARSSSARTKAAISLVLSSHYDHGIEAWQSIAFDFPSEAAGALHQVGTCFHLKKDYRSALEYYGRAIKAGMDSDSISDSIESATASLEQEGR